MQPDPQTASVTIDGNELEYGAEMRLYLTESESSNDHYKPNLLGGVVEYDVDLSNASCGCVSQLYSVLMPDIEGIDDSRNYCNASNSACPEFRLMQANSKAFHSEAHSCNSSGCRDSCILDVQHAQP